MGQNNTAIIIVTYNVADLIQKQIDCIRKFCQDQYDIIVVDNSSDQWAIDAIVYRIQDLNCLYMKTNTQIGDSSFSHAFACNMAYMKYCDQYDYMLFLDHDCFPIKPFSVSGTLNGKILGGMGQTKPSGKTYLWPGCLMIDNTKVDKDIVNFNPNHEFGLDTGGNLYRIIDKYGIGACQFFDEHYHQNIHFHKDHYNHYSIIGHTFMHFINSSNWNPVNTKEENANRLSGLMVILEDWINKAPTGPEPTIAV